MFYSGPKVVYLPDPTWGNHLPVFEQTGMKTMRYRYVKHINEVFPWLTRYRYFDKKTVGLDFKGMKEDIEVCEYQRSCI